MTSLPSVGVLTGVLTGSLPSVGVLTGSLPELTIRETIILMVGYQLGLSNYQKDSLPSCEEFSSQKNENDVAFSSNHAHFEVD